MALSASVATMCNGIGGDRKGVKNSWAGRTMSHERLEDFRPGVLISSVVVVVVLDRDRSERSGNWNGRKGAWRRLDYDLHARISRVKIPGVDGWRRRRRCWLMGHGTRSSECSIGGHSSFVLDVATVPGLG